MEFNVLETRRELHQIPELGNEEIETTNYLFNALTKMGYSPFKVLDTGVVVFIDQGSKTTTCFRSDIDALPIQEENEHDYLSKNVGKMHACGHDGHMTMLLGFADYLSKHKEQIKENILLVFQPAEETTGGAKRLIDAGLFKQYNVNKVFGIHLFPGLLEGIIGSKANEFMAQNGEFDITIHGVSAHGAMPHLGVDSIVVASNLIQRFQQIITRTNSPFASSVITIGTIQGGDARNIIAQEVVMKGTIRSFSNATYDSIVSHMEAICNAEASLQNINIDYVITHGYPPVINDPQLFKVLQKAIPEKQFYEFKEPFMLAEDFSYYQQAVPGLFFYVGTKNEECGYIHPLHSYKFNYNESVLEVGINAYISISKELGVIE